MISTHYLNFIIMFFVLMTTKVSNPVKMSMSLMVISFFMFLKVYSMAGSVWFPSLFFLIFMGGILMMFMILSSILPNEKNVKMKKMVLFIPVMLMLSNFELSPVPIMNITKMVKSNLDSSSSFFFLLMLMLMYFFMSILMISKEETPMRNSIC